LSFSAVGKKEGRQSMATRYHTVSEEMAGTDWSAPEDRAKKADRGESSKFAMLAGVIYLLPPGAY
jgi:hypothetical protein